MIPAVAHRFKGIGVYTSFVCWKETYAICASKSSTCKAANFLRSAAFQGSGLIRRYSVRFFEATSTLRFNPCLGPSDGITLLGSEKAKETGIRIRSYLGLDNSDIFTSPTTRTVQTSDFMLGKSSLLPNREAICGTDIVEKILRHKVANRNLVVMTHNTCINDLIKSSNYKKSGNPEYGSLLFAKTSIQNNIQIIGKLNPDYSPK